jgi:LysM repeat protein
MRLRIAIAALTGAALVAGLSSQPALAAADTNNKTEDKPTSYNVTVQPGDNLTKIGEANSTTYVRLYNANTNINDPDLIYAGEQLRIPAPDEQLADRPLPEKAQAAIAAAPQALKTERQAAKKTTGTGAIVGDGSVWDRLAQCEAGGNWSINTGNGYYGGLQFSASSWRAVGGSGLPSDASREEQIMRGQMLQARAGWGSWPACSAKLGLR